MSRSAAWCLLLALFGAAGGLAATPPSQPPPDGPHAGQPLGEALRALQRQGLAVVFTSRLVKPEMRVIGAPAAGDPRRVLDELLAPHGLAVREQRGLLVVVPAPPAREAPSPAPAARPPAAAPLPVLHEEILVRPSRLSMLEEQVDPSSLAFDRSEIERLPHLADDVFRATSLLPGVAANDLSAQFHVRGGRRDEVGVVLDGQELYVAYHLTDYDSALSLVPSRLLASATLSTGALPASRGDRMGGVLDLRTLPPPAGRQQALGLSILDAFASTSGGFQDGAGGWLLSARRGSLLFARRAIGDERPQLWDALGKVEGTTAAGLLAARLLATGDALQVDHAVEGDREHLDNEYRNLYGWLTHDAGGARLLVHTIASWARLAHDRVGAADEEKGAFELRDRRRVRAVGVLQDWTWQRAAGSLDWGWEARRYDVFFDYFQHRQPAIVIVGPLVPERPQQLRFRGSLRSDHHAGWVREVRAWSERLSAEIGVRYDHHGARGETLLSPRLAFGLRAGERGVLRAAWGRFAQSQRPYELAVGDGETRLHAAERSDQWVLGYETTPAAGRLPLSRLRFELYHRRVHDPRPRFESVLEPANFFPEIEPGRARLAPSASTMRGAELLLRGRPGERGDWWAAYAWSRAEDRLGGRRVPRATDQPHALTVAVSRRLPRQWQLDLAWRWHSGWPTTPVIPLPPAPEPPDPPDDPDDPEEPEDAAGAIAAADDEPPVMGLFGPLASRRFPPYHRLDLRASRRWRSSRGTLTFFVDVQNAYGRRNAAGFDVVVDDETGTVALDSERWPGIVPSLGISWQIGE